jgi:hypothetical protein
MQATIPLTDSQIVEILALARDSDSVELKLTVPDTHYRATVKGLGMDPLDAQIRQVFFFDTPDLRLNQAGVVVRARRVQKRGDDTVVKLRPVVPAELPDELRRSKDVSVEVDAMPGGFVCSASMKGSLRTPKMKKVAAGARPIHELFSNGQRAFYAAHAPAGLELDDLSILGPILVLKLSSSPGSSVVGWSPSCGSIPMARRSSSCPRRRRLPRRSRSLLSSGPTCPSGG